MSPVSRGRKGRKNKKSTPPFLPDRFGAPDACDCPACTDEDFDPQQLIDELIAGAGDLIAAEDPLEAEVAGAAFVSMGMSGGEDTEQALIDGLIPQIEARATPEALAMLLSIGSVATGQLGKAASATADRLIGAGVSPPGWAAELGAPVTVADCWHLRDSQGAMSVLACSFHRAGRSHAVIVTVDHLGCGAALQITLLDADGLAETLEAVRAAGHEEGVEIVTEAMDEAELRWQVEKALDARAVHDSDRPYPQADDVADDDDEDGLPDYPTLAVLLQARMSDLPVPIMPAPQHEEADHRRIGLATLEMLAQFASEGKALSGGRRALGRLPAKRGKAGLPAPVYQLKVGLRGSKPPIWRRLEVPADISLARLHAVIQVAFGWDDSHLHVFETPYGDFGAADRQLGHRAEAPVTLEQVAPDARSKLRYTYDFGDSWEHDILVEKVLDRDQAVSYPRCTGGRRATPPEDCGGIWAYSDLVEILADPTHPEHAERLEWLGLTDAAGFDPASFDADMVTRELTRGH